MDYDALIQNAIRKAVKDAGQNDQLADMLVRWFQEVSAGNESTGDVDLTRKRCEILYDGTTRNGVE